jgi:hypothetical protein
VIEATADSGKTKRIQNVAALSVRDLVRRRRGDDPDTWHLALVQRDEVWDHVRMRYLLDSLLNGYPIGSLLVCRSSGRSTVIRLEPGQRVVAEADPDAWQLLDGQQRINALSSMFTADGRYGRFYLHMTSRHESPDGPVTRRRAKDERLRYIHWQEESEADQAVPERDHHIDLSRWYGWAESGPGVIAESAPALAQNHHEAIRILNAIDPDFTDQLEPADLETAWRRLGRLLDIWSMPSIPVQYLELGSPVDVLEVFTRINRAGVQVAGQDLFFAAVKTLWSDAEQAIARVVERLGPPDDVETSFTPLVDRLGALRVVARLAGRAAGQADLVPLTVDRLSGRRGDVVIEGMRTLTDVSSDALQRMANALHAIVHASTLGFGLYPVDKRLWDDVLGWAAVNKRVDDAEWVSGQVPSIDSYLLGATAFRYPSVLRDRFARLAMTEALAAGMTGDAFPTERIAEVVRTHVPELREGRQRIRGSRPTEDRLWLADNNVELFLSIVQSIPYQPQSDVFDWDHIFPQGKSNLMWSPGPGGRWRRHHQYRRFVGSAGNFWGLDAGANRAAQHRLPGEKFDLIAEWAGKGARPLWPRERWWLRDDEMKTFRDIGTQLAAGEDIDSAMERFHALVTTRALRMVDQAFQLLPLAELFAADRDVAGAAPSPEPMIAKALGIELLEAYGVETISAEAGTLDDRVGRVLRLAEERGSGAALRDFVARAMKLGLQARGYQWTITLTPPTTRTIALIALTPSEKERGLVTTWLAPWAFATHFPDVSAEQFDDALSGVRGSPLDAGQLAAIAGRLEALLARELEKKRDL